MNSILAFIVSFCIISVTLGALYILCPEGSMQKSVKYIFVLLLICACLPLIKGFEDINFNSSRQTYELETRKTAALGARLTYEQALKSAGIEFSKITVCTDKSEGGSIIISEVIVYSGEQEEKIKKIIGNEGEYEVTVINE